MSLVSIAWTGPSLEGRVDIKCSSQSPWSAFLGQDLHPIRGSMDRLDETLPECRIDTLTLRANASSCLMPILWFRTIWASTRDARIVIEWDSLPDATQLNTASHHASRLACLLADRVACAEPELAQSMLGFDPKNPGISEDAYDLLSGIMDLWDPALRSAILGDDWTSAMKAALTECATDGHKRIGIYGAGTHTRSVGDAFMAPPVEVCCIIDDDHRRMGERMWGFKIVTPEQALEMNLDAVVLSANSIEDLLWERTQSFRDCRTDVYRLYTK
jgi:hypothetical protein